MSPESPCPAVRNAARTRAALLTAASEALVERGTAVSLAYIAKKAGVSKGALMHHFASKEALLTALAEQEVQEMQQRIMAQVDLAENTPGKVLRAYVRALCSGDPVTAQYFSNSNMWSSVEGLDGAEEIAAQSNTWLDAQLALDGLDAQIVMVVRRAAEGLATAHAFGEISAMQLAEAGQTLLALTRREAL